MENKVIENRLSTENVSFSYEKNKEILHNISVDFAPQKITALIGANGCGKSTLLHLLAGLRKPDSGNILLNNKNITEFNRLDIAKNIAVVHQSNTAPSDMKVEKLVRTGRTPYRKLFKTAAKEDERIIEKALCDTDIISLADKTISSLSGGQLQRAWLALALAQNTGILLLDEITTYLDIHYQLEIMQLIKKLNQKNGITVIMVLHDINLAMEYCDEAVIMKEGRVLTQGNINEIADENILNKAFNVSSEIIFQNGKRYCMFNLNEKGEQYV